MKKIERIYQTLYEKWQSSTQENIELVQGSTTGELAEKLKISRANVSNYLNQLVNEGRVVKIKRYPVRYLTRQTLIDHNFSVSDKQVVNDLPGKLQVSSKIVDPFDSMVGSQQSLRKAIQQAKAAILYPPTGLHMLLLGPTGSGKTFFAKAAYQFAKYNNTLSPNVSFVSFNCADYYNNPELLMSQLFGYVRGAFTGADKDKPGVIEQADGGVLLLDEVHRLPPEGQEMLFTYMDTGYFARLGEEGKKREATVLIIAATNEDPRSSLLETFLRRIPTVIKIPSFEEKSLREKVQIVNYLFRQEASRIHRDLDVHVGVVESLLLEKNYGNIGQLKSQIQLTCARAFVYAMHNTGDVVINSSHLPDNLQMTAHSKGEENIIGQVTTLVPQHSIFSPDQAANLSKSEQNVYEVITEQIKKLDNLGYSEKDIEASVTQEVVKHLKKFLRAPEFKGFESFISPRTLKLTHEFQNLASNQLHENFDQRFIYYVGMHLDTYFERQNYQTPVILAQELNKTKEKYQEEYAVVEQFNQLLWKTNQLGVPDVERIYLTLLLVSLRRLAKPELGKTGILVMAHGETTATSMVNVANELLGECNILALDMPLTVTPVDIVNQTIAKIEQLDQGRGVLVLVDMGSLTHLREQIEKRTSTSIRVIPFVTTMLVLDAARKATYMETDLDGLYHSIRNDYFEIFASAIRSESSEASALPKIILSICMSGNGTAERLKTIIVNIVNQTTSEPILVQTVSIMHMESEINNILKKYQVIATVGTQDPNISAPHIALDSLLAGDGESQLRCLISEAAGEDSSDEEVTTQGSLKDTIVSRRICLELLEKNLNYLNPAKLVDALLSWMDDLALVLQTDWANGTIVKSIIHVSYAFERTFTSSVIDYNIPWSADKDDLLQTITESLDPYEKQFQLKLPEPELETITDMIGMELDSKNSVQHKQ